MAWSNRKGQGTTSPQPGQRGCDQQHQGHVSNQTLCRRATLPTVWQAG